MQIMYTGERILPGSIFNVTYYQSLVAYQFIATLAGGKTVLDLACGEGYGTALLGKVATMSLGVDRNVAAIEAATHKYTQPNVHFAVGSILKLPALPGTPFDVVCCLQTIEHMQDHNAFIEALKQQTKLGGLLVISTPNKLQFPTFNPYHVHELDLAEVTALCAKHFAKYEIFGVFGDQGVVAYRTSKQRLSRFILKLDFLNLRAQLPRPVIAYLYQLFSHLIIKRFSFWQHRQFVQDSTEHNFTVRNTDLEQALDFIVVAHL